MANRIVKRFNHLARQRATGSIRDRAGNHDRQTLITEDAACFKFFFDRKNSRFRIQGIEHGFDQ